MKAASKKRDKWYCDHCGRKVDTLYFVDDAELCEMCKKWRHNAVFSNGDAVTTLAKSSKYAANRYGNSEVDYILMGSRTHHT